MDLVEQAQGVAVAENGTFVAKNQALGGGCPECGGGPVKSQGGCKVCYGCGWSACG